MSDKTKQEDYADYLKYAISHLIELHASISKNLNKEYPNQIMETSLNELCKQIVGIQDILNTIGIDYDIIDTDNKGKQTQIIRDWNLKTILDK